MKLKGLVFVFAALFMLMFPAFLSAQSPVGPRGNEEEPRLNCGVDFRIFEIKNEISFNSNILGKFGFNRTISRLTVQIIKINASEKQQAEAPVAFKWLQANAGELDFKTIMLSDDEKKVLRETYRKDKKSVFSFNVQICVAKENGKLVGYAHLLGKAFGD